MAEALVASLGAKMAFERVRSHAALYGAQTVLFRVRVGRELVEHLFDGDFEAVHDRTRGKPSSLRAFEMEYGEQLAEMGLTTGVLRRCLLAADVVRDLTEEEFLGLGFSQLAILAEVREPSWRLALMRSALENAWTNDELRAAIRGADAGELTDADAERPGLQPAAPEVADPAEPPPPEPPAPPTAPASVVKQFKATAGVLDALSATMHRRVARPWTTKQAAEAWDAVDHMEARLALLKSRLPPR